MTAFLIKFSLSLFVFFLFYKLVLEREKMHKINRFLLLFALVFSLVIPFVNIEFATENPIIQQAIPSYGLPEIFVGSELVETSIIFTFEHVLWSVYWLGFSVFLFRFIRNLTLLLRSIHKSDKIKKDGFIVVLIPEQILPHSFWNYVFVNQNEYENLIDQELFVHEKAHITQKHSLDILFIEVLQVVFWFHPLVYLYKKAIKLNHEFLADQKVNETFKEVVQYQKLLLQKAVGNLVPIASNLNYSITKKRFVMMTKNQSKLMTISKVSFSLLLFGALFFTFSVKGQEKNTTKNESKYLIPDEKTGKSKEVTPEEFQKYLKDKGVETLNLEAVESESGELNYIPQIIGNYNSKTKVETSGEETTYTLTTNSQVKIEEQDDKVYVKPEVRPEFEGGIQAFYEYIKKNLKTPEVEKDVKGNVIVSFIVEKDGGLSNIKILRDPVGMEKEVTEMLTACPKWKPGIQDGKPVRVEYTLPIAVNIKAKNK
jgi:hypothetical protein